MNVASRPLPDRVSAVVIGGGQAGLATSWHLKSRGIAHVVLERHAPGHAWRAERWDSFCLVTPNWQCTLPDHPYDGPDPDGFMLRDEIASYVEGFARAFDPPLFNGVEVSRVTRDGDGFCVRSSAGTVRAGQVIVATGGYHVPIELPQARALPPSIVQIDAGDYRNPAQLPDGAVLVVGSGQSGAQIAEDLLIAGRDVHLCVGEAPRVSRRYRGRDVVEWLDRMGYYDIPVDRHPLREGVRDNTNHYVTGRDGGRDIDLRAHALAGMHLHGRLVSAEGTRLDFADDLAANLDRADAANASIKRGIDAWIEAQAGSGQALEAPVEPDYVAPWTPPSDRPLRVDLAEAGISAVIWCVGYRMDFSWIEADVFDARGRPIHARGATGCPGLYFVGLPWLYSWGSGRFSGVSRDAEHVAGLVGAAVIG